MKKYFLFLCLMFISRVTLSSQQIQPLDFVPEQRYHLKNGYELSITDAVKQNDHVCSILLSKNGRTVVIEEMAYFNNLKYYPRYEGIDCDDFFAIEFFMGGYSCCLYEKKTGSKVLEFDTAGNRLVFDADNQHTPTRASGYVVLIRYRSRVSSPLLRRKRRGMKPSARISC